MESQNINYFERLDHLRFFAAALVIFFHSWLMVGGVSRDIIQVAIISQGHIGVPFFMVISGFILTIISHNKSINSLNFFLNRILRIYPLFIFVILLGYFATPDPRPSTTLLEFFLAVTPFSNISRMVYGQYGGQFWSIAVELQFYLLFPFIHSLVKKRGAIFLFSIIIFFVFIRAIIFFINGSVYDLAYFSIFGCLDAFLIGQLTGTLFAAGSIKYSPIFQKYFKYFLLALLVIAVQLAERFGWFAKESKSWIVLIDVLSIFFGIFILVYLNDKTSSQLSKFFAGLGRISYSLYAWHILVIVLLMKLGLSSVHPYLFGTITLLVSCVISMVSYHLIELPFLYKRVKYASSV
jgi:peptidoglycan/LPS O-acetylase OafA/YrhL